MEKGRYVTVIERKEVRGDNAIEYFLFTGVKSTFRVSEGVMAIEISHSEEISGGGKNGGRKGVGSAIFQRRANRGSINIKEQEQGGVV